MFALFFCFEMTAAVVISLDCNTGACPLVESVVTCRINNSGTVIWRYSPPPDTLIGLVSEGVPTRTTDGYTATYIGNGVTTVTFNSTADRNTTVLECTDATDSDSDTCTIIIAG